MDYSVKVLADSIGPHGVRLTTFELRYPRAAVHEDFLTHRDFSRNASSSRAIPIAKMIERADWCPEVFGKNRAGMGATDSLDATRAAMAEQVWALAMANAHAGAEMLRALGVVKEDANLLLRPFEWIDVVVSSTRWAHFFNLRGSGGNARKQCQRVADGMRDLLASSEPTYLQPGQWHLPYLTAEELALVCDGTTPRTVAALASAMRCARVSYARHDGARNDVGIDATDCVAKLIEPGHWSPLEHAAQCCDQPHLDYGNYDPGWWQLRKSYPAEYRAA